MTTGYALLDRPNPNYTQGRPTRRNGARVVGLAVVHTFEIAPDPLPPDLSAERGLHYLRTRDTPGCYHRLCDTDSRVPLYPWAWETWQCRFTNNWSNGFCMATEANKWGVLSREHQDRLLENCARDIAAFFLWMKQTHGVDVPIRWLGRNEALARQPGLTMHRITDPARRSDPGFSPNSRHADLLLQMVGDYTRTPGEIPISRDRLRPGLLLDGDFGEFTIRALQGQLQGVGEGRSWRLGRFDKATAKAYQRWLIRSGFNPGALDGDFGPVSTRAEQAWLHSHGLYNEEIHGRRDGLTIYALQQALNKGKIS